MIDREQLVARVRQAIAQAQPVNVRGADGAGKTYVIRAAPDGARAADGIVWIEVASRSAGDALQGVFEALYDSHPRIATPEERRAAFAGIRALVVLEDASAICPRAVQVLTELSDSTVVMVTRPAVEWDAAALDAVVDGLDSEAALELLGARCPGAREDAQAARRLVALVRGNPRRLRQAATLLEKLDRPIGTLVKLLENDPDTELRRLLRAALEPADQEILDVLAGACGATLAAERLRALTGIADASGSRPAGRRR